MGNCINDSSPAFYAPHHERMAHGGSYSDGHVQWHIVELHIGWIRHGEPVCDHYHRRLNRTSIDVHVLSSCHFGNIIEYDTVTNLSWSVDVRTHAIAQMVDKVLSEPWQAASELGLEVPPLKRQDDCMVSYRVPSRNVESFSYWCGAAAGLLQMGLWKLQPMIGNLCLNKPDLRKHYYVIRSDTINWFRKVVREQATRRNVRFN